MADPELIGEWHIGKPFEMPPQWLVDFKENVNTIAQFLIASMELANVVLDVIKTFLVGINDPISALIKALIKEIEKILKDIQQIGLYFTSDRKLVGWPPKDLLGGYTAAEKRMVGRLTDRTDPGRPDLSPNTLMLGFMFYASADTRAFYELISTLNKILKIFSFSYSGNKFATVSNLVAEYKASDPEYQPSFDKYIYTAPEFIEVRWSQKSTSDLMGIDLSLFATALTKPNNYIVEVSTEPLGLPIYVTKQDPNKTSPGGGGLGGSNKNGTPQLKSFPVKVREEGEIVDFYLFGGVDRITTDLPKYKNLADKNGKVKAGSAYLHTILPNIDPSQPIPIELLKDDSDSNNPIYYLQRTFIFGEDSGTPAIPQLGGTHTFKIRKEDLPKAIKITGTGSDLVVEEDTDNPPITYYFRVTPADKFNGTPFARYTIEASDVYSDRGILSKQKITMGKPCHPYRMQMPRDTTALYQASIESAIVSLLLCRPDLDSPDPESTNRTPFLTEDKRKIYGLLGINPTKFFAQSMSVQQFRTRVRDIVRSQTYILMNTGGLVSAPVEKFVVDNSALLREFKWSDYNDKLPSFTLRESVKLTPNEDVDDDSGIAPNTKSLVLSNLELEPALRKQIPIPEDLQASFVRIPATFATERMTKDAYQKKIQTIRAKYNGDTDPDNNAFAKSEKETLDYLENAVLKGDDGELLTFQDDKGIDYVSLFPKSKYYSDKKQMGSSPIMRNGNSPLVYNDYDEIVAQLETPTDVELPIVFTRTALISYNNAEVLHQAAFVLNIASASMDKRSESEWDYVRLGDIGVFYYIESFLNTILNFVKGLMDGLQGIIDNILKFIDYLQQRINEVQNLIRRINALIQSIGLFEIPSVNLLLFASSGTDGVLRDLISSTNKPQDPTSALGFGALALVPIPLANVIVDLFYPDVDIDGLLDTAISDLSGEEE